MPQPLNKFTINPDNPEYYRSAVVNLKRYVDLQVLRQVPECIRVWMLLVPMLRVLRAVFGGNNIEAVEKLRDYLIAKKKAEDEFNNSEEGQRLKAMVEAEMKDHDL